MSSSEQARIERIRIVMRPSYGRREELVAVPRKARASEDDYYLVELVDQLAALQRVLGMAHELAELTIAPGQRWLEMHRGRSTDITVRDMRSGSAELLIETGGLLGAAGFGGKFIIDLLVLLRTWGPERERTRAEADKARAEAHKARAEAENAMAEGGRIREEARRQALANDRREQLAQLTAAAVTQSTDQVQHDAALAVARLLATDTLVKAAEVVGGALDDVDPDPVDRPD